MRKIAWIIMLMSFSSVAAVCSAEQLIGSGCSVSNEGYLRELAREYEARTGVKVIVRGGGTVIGIEDLRNGTVDFAASCRTRDESDPKDIQFIQVAWDALVFITHPSNHVGAITLDEVRAIYAGRTTTWKQLKGSDAEIKIFVARPRKGLSGVEASTSTLVLQGDKPAETPNTTFLASTGIVEQMVENTAEGFATTGFSSARKRSVRMLKLDGVSPTAKNIIEGRYPLKRPLFILLPAKPTPAARKFVDFVLSGEGQDFIRSQGVVSRAEIK